MSFATYRADRGLTLEQCAVELELSPKSRGWLSEIERGVTDASLRLALRIERWSGGAVTAASVCSELRDEPGSHDRSAPAVDDGATLAVEPVHGAENRDANISGTGGAT